MGCFLTEEGLGKMPTVEALSACSTAKAAQVKVFEPGQNGLEADCHAARAAETDSRIVAALHRLSNTDKEYWEFRGCTGRGQSQGLTQYPAMMVPAMQAVLIKVVADIDGGVTRVFDPFVGSGTTLVECMRLGLNYEGQDINPLAVLLCRTKVGPFHVRKLCDITSDVVERAQADRGRQVEAEFPNLEKWFCPTAITQLSRLRRAIRRVNHVWCRRVLWTALAETIRLTSNSRTSTFKLHVRSKSDLDTRNVAPLKTFAGVVSDVTRRLHDEADALRQDGRLTNNGFYRGDLKIRLRDSVRSGPGTGAHDLLISSPPYGDNATTVPYGQYSYLPLQWIDLEDIDEGADVGCLRTTHEIDSRSLGGSRRHAVRDIASLRELSPSLEQTLSRLSAFPVDRGQRVAAFWRDLSSALHFAVAALRPSSYMIWTVGNRQVGGAPIPTDAILNELLAAEGVRPVTRVERRIPSKRMARRNSIAKTMNGEVALVFRKA